MDYENQYCGESCDIGGIQVLQLLCGEFCGTDECGRLACGLCDAECDSACGYLVLYVPGSKLLH